MQEGEVQRKKRLRGGRDKKSLSLSRITRPYLFDYEKGSAQKRNKSVSQENLVRGGIKGLLLLLRGEH